MLAQAADVPPTDLIFASRIIAEPAFTPNAELKPITADTALRLLPGVPATAGSWALAADLAPHSGGPQLARRLDAIERIVLKLAAASDPTLVSRRLADEHGARMVVQWCLAEDGLWHGVGRSAPSPRMRFDPLAPSRSYLKIEEAFWRMGVPPQPGERAIDLGAAPGGWTYAFVKRGCAVLAVDHGPLKLPPARAGWGRVRHERANGITFAPPPGWQAVDWLVCDMLVAPGVALGLLRRWMQRRAMRLFICNIKLPQEKAYAALQPILSHLRAQQSAWKTSVCQLYHDRREVTVLGERR